MENNCSCSVLPTSGDQIGVTHHWLLHIECSPEQCWGGSWGLLCGTQIGRKTPSWSCVYPSLHGPCPSRSMARRGVLFSLLSTLVLPALSSTTFENSWHLPPPQLHPCLPPSWVHVPFTLQQLCHRGLRLHQDLSWHHPLCAHTGSIFLGAFPQRLAMLTVELAPRT